MLALGRRTFRVLLPLFSLVFGPAPMTGQVLTGRLLDDQTGDPVPGANVTLLLGERVKEVIKRSMTDENGGFSVAAKGGGRFRIRVDRIGYKEVLSPHFDLVRDDTLEVELRMSVDAVPLAPLTVVSDRSPLLLSRHYEIGGFIERKYTYGDEGLGVGTFLEREDWEHRSPVLISDLLRTVRGVRVRGGAVRLRTTSISEPLGCLPEWYLDGQHIRFNLSQNDPSGLRGESMDDLISVISLAAVEVYHGNSKPPQFMDMGNHACGAIVLWSG